MKQERGKKYDKNTDNLSYPGEILSSTSYKG